MKIMEHDGKVISKPGIYSGIDIEDYHHNPFLCDGPSISSTGIKQVIARPSVYWAYSPYNKKRFERAGTDALNFGKAAHMLLLGEEGFSQRYALRPETYPNDQDKKWNSNSKDCKAWLEEQVSAGRTVITQTEIDKIRYMRDSLSKHTAIQNGVLNGLIEHTMLTRRGKIWVRTRPDAIPKASGDFADLKTTDQIRYEDLERAIYNYGYHVQAALVRMNARLLMGEGFEFGTFLFVFVEKSPPYDVRVVEIRSEDMDLGEQQVNIALDRMQKCIDRWQWPGDEGFSQTIAPIGLPGWARTRIENEITYLKQEA